MATAGALGGAALGLGGALSPSLLPSARATTSNFQPYNYVIYQDASNVYALNGATGNIDKQYWDAATVIQYAIDHANAVNPPPNTGGAWDTLGGRVFIKNSGVGLPYQINSGVTFRSYVSVESDGATLRNNQGSSLQFPFVSDSNQVLYMAKILGLILDANTTYNGVGLALFGPQRSVFDVFIKNCVTGLDLRSSFGMPQANIKESVLGVNAGLSEYNLQVDNCQGNAALQLAGTIDSQNPQHPVTSVVTNNRFRNINLSNIGTTTSPASGIALVQACDTNKFDQVWIGLTGNNSIGVTFNRSSYQNLNVGVYNIQFDKLSVDAFGRSNINAVYLNWSKGIQIDQLYVSPEPVNGAWGPGNVLYVTSYAQSYEIGDYAQNIGNQVIVRRGLRVTNIRGNSIGQYPYDLTG
jgi:hypothetical protein